MSNKKEKHEEKYFVCLYILTTQGTLARTELSNIKKKMYSVLYTPGSRDEVDVKTRDLNEFNSYKFPITIRTFSTETPF